MIDINKYTILLLLFVISGIIPVYGQKYDYTWLSGYDSKGGKVDSAQNGFAFGNVKMNFNDTPIHAVYDSLAMNFYITNTTVSDTGGNLLFYSNGIYVANFLNDTMVNGDSLNDGYVTDVFAPLLKQVGYKTPQGIIGIPDILNPNRYYLFHSFIDTLPGTNAQLVYCHKTLVSLVDMNANNGLGALVYKNGPLIVDSLSDPLQGVKHGNGRDWWILVQKQNSNCYYRVLLDSAGPQVLPDLDCLGDTIPPNDLNVACFSPDGSKYVFLGYISGLNIYDFDRCTGNLSNAKHLPLPVIADSAWYGLGVAISPNNRYLYVSLTHQLYQFDLSNPDVFSTLDTVGIYNGGHLPGTPGDENTFGMEQLAPDGKIYIGTGNGTNVFHVINNPDEQGSACNFVQGGLVLPGIADDPPNYPNYRLGALTQSQCDTLGLLSDIQRAAKEQIIKVYPNPSSDYVIVDYGFTDWSKARPNLEICNALGQTVYTQTLPMYSGLQKIDVSGFASGMYTVYIKRQGTVVATQKLIKSLL